MLSRCEQPGRKTRIDVETAQILRGQSAFGSVAFHLGPPLQPDQIDAGPGYADCLPLIGGGRWRDPASPETTEVLR